MSRLFERFAGGCALLAALAGLVFTVSFADFVQNHGGLRARRLAQNVGRVGVVSAALLLIVYVRRLTVLNPKNNLVRVAALMSGLVALPLFYGLLGRELLGRRAGPPAASD